MGEGTQIGTPTTSGAPGVGIGVAANAHLLLWAGFMAILAEGVGFSIRAGILGDWGAQFGFTQGELGRITGGGLTGFGITIILFSFFTDRVGYGPLMAVAFSFHALSAVVTLAATPVFHALGKNAAYQCLYWGMFMFALGNGTMEAVVNPMTATLFPRQRTHWLNILHAGWPAGLMLGALLGVLFKAAGHVRWEIQMTMFLIPTLAYGLMMFHQRFPHSEARTHGVTIGRMTEEIGFLGAAVVIALLGLWLWSDVLPALGLPGSLGWVVALVAWVGLGLGTNWTTGHWMIAALLALHALVGYVELGTDSWISNITGTILADPKKGLMLLLWTSGLMCALRFFAGPIVERINPLGLLFAAASVATVGLFLLGHAGTGIACIIATTIYGLGKTYYWPTMLGVASERFPKGGALLMGLTGTAGMLSQFFVVPLMGKIYDNYTQLALDRQGLQLKAAIADKTPAVQHALQMAQTEAAPFAFRYVSAAAIVLIVVFGIIWLRDRASGGYKAERITPEEVAL